MQYSDDREHTWFTITHNVSSDQSPITVNRTNVTLYGVQPGETYSVEIISYSSKRCISGHSSIHYITGLYMFVCIAICKYVRKSMCCYHSKFLLHAHSVEHNRQNCTTVRCTEGISGNYILKIMLNVVISVLTNYMQHVLACSWDTLCQSLQQLCWQC